MIKLLLNRHHHFILICIPTWPFPPSIFIAFIHPHVIIRHHQNDHTFKYVVPFVGVSEDVSGPIYAPATLTITTTPSTDHLTYSPCRLCHKFYHNWFAKFVIIKIIMTTISCTQQNIKQTSFSHHLHQFVYYAIWNLIKFKLSIKALEFNFII